MIHLIRDRKSRYDIQNIQDFCGPALEFWNACLKRMNYTGEWMHHLYTNDYPVTYTGYNLGDTVIFSGQCGAFENVSTIRGHFDRLRTIRTFGLQDACDHKRVEDLDDDDDDEGGNFKDSAPTRFRNYRFWVQRDIFKALQDRKVDVFRTMIRLTAIQMIDCLLSVKAGDIMCLDIETRYEKCICFSVKINYNETVSYLAVDYTDAILPNTVQVFSALVKAMHNATTVVHNAAYDLPFLAFYHGLPFGKNIYCTMASHHRLFPEADKSLAHCISLYTNFENHKTTSINITHNRAQDEYLLVYNSKDVQVLRTIYDNQLALAATDKGWMDSIVEVNRTLPIYFTQMLHGFRIDEHRQFIKTKMLERRLVQIQRIADVLLGHDLKFDLNSSHQCVKYFHDQLLYPPIMRTVKGKPSLKGDALYMLATKHNNPMIQIIINYREMAKELSLLNVIQPPRRT